MKRSVTDVKLNVKPVFIGFEHQYYYEGPCRMAGGDAIKPGFDAIVQGKKRRRLTWWMNRAYFAK